MKDCPECGGDVRSPHSFCPECGVPLSSPAKATARTDGPSGSSGPGSNATADSDGMSRRDLMLAGGGALGAAAVGGGVGFVVLSGGGESADPAGVAQRFFERLDAGDVDAVQGMFHEEVDTGPITEDQVTRMESIDLSVTSTQVLSENETHAKVSVVMDVKRGEQSVSQNNTLLLRTQDGEWRVRGIAF